MTDAAGHEVPFSPTEPFRFCPADGTKLGAPRESGGVTCPRCGRSWYRSSMPAVGAVIVEDGRALVTIRAREPEKGRLDLPGGFLEVGEHPADGLVREIKEELGVEAKVIGDSVLQATHTYGDGGDWVLAVGFRVRLLGGEIRPADDVAGVRWVSLGEIDGLDFAWAHDRALVRAALEREDA